MDGYSRTFTVDFYQVACGCCEPTHGAGSRNLAYAELELYSGVTNFLRHLLPETFHKNSR
jgi:hypothetical protein